jgi:glycosyltransferase involved in cell wall biosynthesis
MKDLNQTSEITGRQPLLMVVPCFNEASRFNSIYFQELCAIEGTIWFFVDDGSVDATLEVLKSFCTKKNTKILKLPNNVGKSEAIRLGLLDALRDHPNALWCGFLDSDGAFNSREVEGIVLRAKSEEFESHHSLFTSRVKLSGRDIHRKTYRHLIGRLIATMFGLIWKDIPYDTQSGFKIFRNNRNFKESIAEPFTTRWFFDIEIIARIASKQDSAPNIWEEPLNSWIDISGSKISTREKIRLAREIPRVMLVLVKSKNCLNKID